MARASYVYLVEVNYECPVAAFTVKHEAVKWLKTQADYFWDDLTVYRMKDNPPDGSRVMPHTVAEFCYGDA